jgi:hypothetical protein
LWWWQWLDWCTFEGMSSSDALALVHYYFFIAMLHLNLLFASCIVSNGRIYGQKEYRYIYISYVQFWKMFWTWINLLLIIQCSTNLCTFQNLF